MAKHDLGYDQIVYLLQGNGARGAYQTGAYMGLHEVGFTPDWVIGTSVGAIHAAIIVGNEPQHRVDALKKFWETITSPQPSIPYLADNPLLSGWYNFWSSQWSLFFGQSRLFAPHVPNPWFSTGNTSAKFGFYDTNSLRKTLEQLIDFKRINSNEIRLTLGAVQTDNGQFVHFDNSEQNINIEHVMASAALPPGFPAVEIEGKTYWDGGTSSNTPLSILLKEKVTHKSLCFMMHLFEPLDLQPTSLNEMLKLRQEIAYSGHYREIIRNYYIIQKLRHAIKILGNKIPVNKHDKKTKALIKLGTPTLLNLVRFHYQTSPADLATKDNEFSAQSITKHIQIGYQDLMKAFENTAWLNPQFDDKGIVMHEF